MADPSSNPGVWSIVLAGGNGERLRPLIQSWLGCEQPKQYCAFTGSRSMFQHTVDRADRLCPPHRRVTVIIQSHLREVLGQLAGRSRGKLLVQPANRDTAAAVFLALTYIREYDPRATVVIYPSDHFLHPESRFLEVARAAIRTADLLSDQLVLLAAPARYLEPDYGWIRTGRAFGWVREYCVSRVEAFIEKPDLPLARELMDSGAVWNTMILAARLQALWEMGWQCFPELMELLEKWGNAVGSPDEEALLKSTYQQMPARNFSSHLLQRVPERIASVPMSGILWSDWGRPERIVEALQWIGKLPAFCKEGECAWCEPSPHPLTPAPGTRAVA